MGSLGEVGEKALGMTIHRLDIRTSDDVEGAFATMAERQLDALLVADEAHPSEHYRRIAELAATHRLPTISPRTGFAAEGGLLDYGLDLPVLCRRAVTYADKLLKGAKPGDLPIERFEKSLLTVNLKTAEALGITIPPSLLLLANEVIR